MKIKLKAKNRKDKVASLLLENEVNHWLNENREMWKDCIELMEDVSFFKVKWGIPLDLCIGEVEENKGRWLGVGNVEKLFEPKTDYGKKI